MEFPDIQILQDEEGNDFFPGTITDAVGHAQAKVSLTDMMDDYNLTTIWPNDGINTTSAYNLGRAIEVLDLNLLAKQKKPGVKARFTNSGGKYEEWEYFGGGYDFTDIMGWRQTDSSILLELEETVFPVSVEFTVGRSLGFTNTTYEVPMSWKVYRKGIDVTLDAMKYLNNELTDKLSTTETISSESRTTLSYTFAGTYQGLTKTMTKQIQLVDPCYYGIVPANWSPTGVEVKETFTQALNSSRSFTWSGISLNNQKTAYVIPQYFGQLSSIKDANNFEYLSSYEQGELRINGVSYYLYTLKDPVTITGFKQIFS